MTIVSHQQIREAVAAEMLELQSTDLAIAVVADRFALPIESVREIVAPALEGPIPA